MELEKRPALKILIRCPDCGSSNTLHRQRNNNFVCRKCGKVFDNDKAKLRKGR